MKKYYVFIAAALLAACSCGNKPGTGTDPEPDPDPTPDPPVPVVVERPAFARGADINRMMAEILGKDQKGLARNDTDKIIGASVAK